MRRNNPVGVIISILSSLNFGKISVLYLNPVADSHGKYTLFRRAFSVDLEYFLNCVRELMGRGFGWERVME